MVSVSETLRPLRGQNRPSLVRADDGRIFVQKCAYNSNSSDPLFNEAFASQLGMALGLPFASWCELIADSSEGPQSTFGSEQISGDFLEYLPGEWYRNVE